jgi:hypothetical protein
MKKILAFLLLAALTAGETKAQIAPKTDKPKDSSQVKMKPSIRNEVRVKTQPVPADNTPYYLTSVKVDILTGNDNKELSSRINVLLNRPGGSSFQTDPNEDGSSLLYNYMSGNYSPQEFKPNSNIQLVLPTPYQFPYTFPGGAYDGYRYYELLLSSIQVYGLKLFIAYSPNFPLDAWKIEKVTMTLEFKDLTGKPHPSMGTVVVPFINASALLNEGNRRLICETDKFLMPTRVSVAK